jgi:hypothetical protein
VTSRRSFTQASARRQRRSEPAVWRTDTLD